jgi:hypothetical protein
MLTFIMGKKFGPYSFRTPSECLYWRNSLKKMVSGLLTHMFILLCYFMLFYYITKINAISIFTWKLREFLRHCEYTFTYGHTYILYLYNMHIHNINMLHILCVSNTHACTVCHDSMYVCMYLYKIMLYIYTYHIQYT